jgi:hypothetical protein
MDFWNTMKLPSAFVPVAMSAAALCLVFAQLVFFGAAPKPDEGAAAHLWQLLMAGQVLVVAFFAFRWVPKRPRPALAVLALQIVVFIAALAPIYFLHW